MRDVRTREGIFEGKCDACLEWWPLEDEFWYPRRSLRHCRACENLRHRVQEAIRRRDPAYHARTIEAQRVYRNEARDALRISRNEHEAMLRMADPDRIVRHRAYHRDRTRAYRQRKREKETAA